MCEYCDILVDYRKNLLECEGFEIYIDGLGKLIQNDDNGSFYVEAKINYCPMCWRKLDED